MDKKSYHHGNLEEALIEAGLSIVDQKGLESMSLRGVAAACGVSHAAPYKHFSSKEELLKAMEEYVEEQFAQAMEESLKQESKENREVGYMLEMARAYMNFFIENPHYFSFVQRQQGDDWVNLNDLYEVSRYKPFEIFKNEALKHLACLNLSKELERQTVIAMWAMVHGCTSLSIMNGVVYDGDWQELLISILVQNTGTISISEDHKNCR